MATNVGVCSLAGACAMPAGVDVLADLLYFKNHRRSDFAVPEKALMFAVLAEATETYQKNAFAKSARRQALFREVEEWFLGESAGYLFSFPTICEVLGFDPEFLRQGLRQWRTNGRHDAPARRVMQVHSVRSDRRKPMKRPVRRVASITPGRHDASPP
jgi:hypothetical protein